jgi:hypothetical protein
MHWLEIARMYENQFMLLFAWVTGLGLATLLSVWLLMVMAFLVKSSPAPGASRGGKMEV